MGTQPLDSDTLNDQVSLCNPPLGNLLLLA